ncbi:MAG TPA: sulfatase-like hydrolase/transferase, partial [Armatimonadota bacterium]|nr:sulfatase-like hydrolase/transferase [Armatimonadota bacterium]
MPRPNVLLITTDQHNAQIMGCAGNPAVRTPNLDALAARGVIFDAAYTPHPVCTPARTSIFTGQYAARHGVGYNMNLRINEADPSHMTGLSADATAFPEVLAGAGYDTSLFGKLHAKQAGGKNFGLRHTRLAEGKGQFVEHGSGPDDYRQYLRGKGYGDEAWRTWEMPKYAERGHVTS